MGKSPVLRLKPSVANERPASVDSEVFLSLWVFIALLEPGICFCSCGTQGSCASL